MVNIVTNSPVIGSQGVDWFLFLASIYLLLLDLQFHLNRFLFVLAPFVLEPDANHTRRQACHLDQLFFHQGVRPGIRIVTRSAKDI